MIAKVTLLLALASAASAGIARPNLAYYQPAPQAIAVQAEPVDFNPKYAYTYSVHDGVTGDQKAHTESRDGETVQGEYSLVDPDGTLRTVRYIANKDGYNAVVSRQLGYAAPAPVIVRKVAPVAPAAYGAFPAVQFRTAVQPAAVDLRQTFQRPVLYQPAAATPAVYKISSQIPYGYKTGYLQPKVVQKALAPAPVFAHYPAQHNFVTSPVISSQPQLIFQQQHLLQRPQPVPTQPLPAQQEQEPVAQQPEPVQEQPEPQPQPVEQPEPAQQPQPVQLPQPVQQPQPSRPQPPQQPPPQQQEPVQADDSAAVVVEAAPSLRSSVTAAADGQNTNNRGEGSSFTYSSKGKQYDFNVAY